MKLNKKLLAVAIGAAMMATGVAEAKIEATDTITGTGSELILSVWDKTASTSYTLDLGIFQSDAKTMPSFTRAIGDANFTSFLGSIASGDTVVYSVMGGSSLFNVDADLVSYGFMSTLKNPSTVADMSGQFIDDSRISFADSKLKTFIGAVNTKAGESAGSLATNASVVSLSGSNAWNASKIGSNLNSAMNNLNAWGDAGDTLHFYRSYLLGSVDAGVTATAAELGTWTFNINGGSASLAYAPTSAVPVPAAIWMFMSGLMGMVAMNRRKNATI